MTLINMQATPYFDDVIQVQRTHDGITHHDFNLNLLSVCAVYVLLNNDQILDQFFKLLCSRAITS